MRRLLVLCLLLVADVAAHAQLQPSFTVANWLGLCWPLLPQVRPVITSPFGGLRYEQVVAFDYGATEGEEGEPLIVDAAGRLAPTIRQWRALAPLQAATLMACVSAPATYGAAAAFCFEPHLGIVYFRQGQPVAHLSICLSCNRLRAYPELLPTRTATAEGFSPVGRAQLTALCQQLRFSHCLGQPPARTWP